ncbi:hypothetical protein O7626_23795 [Micromonospora sp. WMMD1102]|nr:hypothetical protein [Micromonospora sp. WMMD1102]MDG4788913.1 hypothetical protein [Micromonospora sp. WMMD1102]
MSEQREPAYPAAWRAGTPVGCPPLRRTAPGGAGSGTDRIVDVRPGAPV